MKKLPTYQTKMIQIFGSRDPTAGVIEEHQIRGRPPDVDVDNVYGGAFTRLAKSAHRRRPDVPPAAAIPGAP
jgi:hypothetical protein